MDTAIVKAIKITGKSVLLLSFEDQSGRRNQSESFITTKLEIMILILLDERLEERSSNLTCRRRFTE